MERRQFIRDGCKLCAGIAGMSMLSGLITSCSPLPIYNTVSRDQKVTVPFGQFEKSNFVIVRCINVNYDIAVIRQPDGGYKSLVMQCTHAANPIDFNGNEFTCSLHGSIFSRTGDVKRGPAERPLIALLTETENNEVIIYPGKKL